MYIGKNNESYKIKYPPLKNIQWEMRFMAQITILISNYLVSQVFCFCMML